MIRSTPSHRSKRAGALVLTGTLAFGGLSGLVTAVTAGSADATPLSRSFAMVTRWRADPLSRAATEALDLFHQDGATSATFIAARRIVAVDVAGRTTATADQLEAAWVAAGDQRTAVILAALAQVGVPYRRNTSAPGVSFDCSGLTMYAWSTVGVDLPHQSERQMAASTARTADVALAGDLVQYPGHVMLSLGVGRIIVHAPNTGHLVEVREVSARRSVRFASPLP